jgi:hypothetical protein
MAGHFMFEFSAKIFDDWQDDYEKFNYSFRYFCFMQFRAFGLHAEFVPNVTKQIHAQWVSDCKLWLKVETPPQTKRLSYLKRASLLLHSLVSLQFLGNMVEHDYQEDPKVSFRGSTTQFEYAKKDLIDAREVVISLDFVLNIIDYFEFNRADRLEKYVVPLTIDMRHDLIGYLLSDSVDPKSLYLILKALYLRHSAGGAAN